MAKILLISILLTVVYSWEELKWTLRRLAFSIFKTPPLIPPLGRRGRKSKAIDQKVGILVILATVPIGLMYLILNADGLWAKLLWIGVALLGIALAAIVSELLLRRAQYAQFATPFVSLFSLISPVAAVMAETAYLPRRVLAKFALLLSLPPLLGLVFHHLNYSSSLSLELLPQLDILIIVLVGSLFLRVAVEFLEHYFHFYNLEKLFSYYRIALGIVLAVVLILG